MITEFIVNYKTAAPVKLPSGHRIFEAVARTGETVYAVADDSGDWPHTTDDGPMFLDSARTLKVGRFDSIPIYDEEGSKYSIPGDAATILFLANWLGWIIEDQSIGNHYHVKK